MARFQLTQEPLVLNPLKVGQSIGASLAFLGLDRCMPLQHGARGCTSFNKLFFMRHFREPIPLQTTAMELTTVVMGADANVVEALQTICERNNPAVIGLTTTGLSATQGVCLQHSLKAFREQFPQYSHVAVIPVETCDSQGGLEAGYALALMAILKTLLPMKPYASVANAKYKSNKIALLPSPMLTPADIEAVKEWIESYGFSVICLPDISLSLDGSLLDDGFTTLTQGGTSLSQIAEISDSDAVITIGQSLNQIADWLQEYRAIPQLRLTGLHSLKECDQLNMFLSDLSGEPVTARQQRLRRQLLDAMVDTQFRLGVSRIAVGCESDLLFALESGLSETGCELVATVIPTLPLNASSSLVKSNVQNVPTDVITVGDLGVLEHLACQQHAELLITNSHGLEISERVGIPLLSAGYPLHKHAGAHATQWIGYAGVRQTLYRIDNLLASGQQTVTPYRSSFWPQRDLTYSVPTITSI
jgi:nitrogenase molybdenum-iron cofactor biosynthesis protein NifN